MISGGDIHHTFRFDSIAHHPRGLSRRALSRVQLYIDEHLGEPFTSSDLARMAGVSRFHFSRLFRCSTGASPMQFVRMHRLAISKDLLSQGDLSIAEIASEVGFCDQSHYCRTFRRMTGITPSAFAQASDSTKTPLLIGLKVAPDTWHPPTMHRSTLAARMLRQAIDFSIE